MANETRQTRRTRGVLGGRSDAVVESVLAATVGEIATSGYRAFRMDHVCANAGVNKTTVYRRWPTKALLVAAAVASMRAVVHDVPLPDTGSVERDLVGAFRRRLSFHRRVEGQAWARLLAEKHDPELGPLLAGSIEERSGAWYAMITRAIERGELPRGTDPKLMLGMLGAIVDAWDARSPGREKVALVETAVRTIVAGARAGTVVAGSRRVLPAASRQTRT